MKPRRLPSGAWNCRVMIDGQSYSFTHADKKTVVRMASDFARRIIVPIRPASPINDFPQSPNRTFPILSAHYGH